MNLSDPGVAKQVTLKLKQDIDNYCLTYDDGHRNHLGASLIGHECKRYLWYVFRWCYREPTTGRQQRLFNRGHREEERFLEWLRGVGCDISDKTKEGTQHRIKDCMGHFGGSLDGRGFLPPSYGISEEVLFEFKTNGTGAGFTSLLSKGLQLSKEQHYAQTCTYGYKEHLNYVAYLNICKNDDDLYIEVCKLDHSLGERMIKKAETIIFSNEPPPKLSEQSTYFKCTYCGMKGVCHGAEKIEKNCRSCKLCFPVDNAQWFCKKYNSAIPPEYIKLGCEERECICRR